MSWERDAPKVYGPKRARRTFVLLFDGTGNKFSGTDSDSNILKILRMLDRNDSKQIHYYQPGIGTYVHTNSYSHTSMFTRVNSWIQKTRDSAIGTSFDYHVMGGYKFLMKYYEAGDDIYFFGFSRGAYIARFLAEMLDHVGLLEAGNEEMARFAWKAFSQWQMRLDGTDEEREKKRKMFHYLQAFRDTFSRPVRRIRFLGLFDTVNSVPRFESAWMERSKFPYTAKSSAIVIRHAVGIDERRAKFRQDLISEKKDNAHNTVERRGRSPAAAVEETLHIPPHGHAGKQVKPHDETQPTGSRYRRKSHVQHRLPNSASGAREASRERSRERSFSPGAAQGMQPQSEVDSHQETSSILSMPPPRRQTTDDSLDSDEEDENIPQDIQEVWFPGGHADIGGGWCVEKSEDLPLSHPPLVWMIREARKAGLRFDIEKMTEMRCYDPDEDKRDYFSPVSFGARQAAPNGNSENTRIRVSDAPPTPGQEIPSFKFSAPESPDGNSNGVTRSQSQPTRQPTKFEKDYTTAAQIGVLHDCLEHGEGLTKASVLGWKFMEYLPFKRMDLLPDRSWQSIRWPLPKGETRDMPDHALVHHTALRRMEHNPNYRPGNLIVGGGGRGVRRAPEEHGTGDWEIACEKGDIVGECVTRKKRVNTGDLGLTQTGTGTNGVGADKEKEKEHN